jgi:hypothetical protein
MQESIFNITGKSLQYVRIIMALGAIAAVSATAVAQAPADNVVWTVTVTSGATPVKTGSVVTLDVNGSIDEGWHVYGLKQLPGGPTALRVTVDANDTGQAAGDPSESQPQKIHDLRFGLDTQFHSGTVTLHLPVRVTSAAAGNRTIPVSVRFQLCSEGECKPPRSVHLTAPIEVTPDA